DYYHKKLGKIMWNNVGLARNAQGLTAALKEIEELHEDFLKNVRVVGKFEAKNSELEKAGRLVDYFELAKLMAKDALERDESCGCHFREEHQTEDGEAKRDDENFKYVAAWEFKGTAEQAKLHKEELEFHSIELATRSYK